MFSYVICLYSVLVHAVKQIFSDSFVKPSFLATVNVEFCFCNVFVVVIKEVFLPCRNKTAFLF